MNLRKMHSRHLSLIVFIALFWAKAVWEFCLSHDLRLFLLECVETPILLGLLFLFFGWAFKKIDRNTNFLLGVVLVFIWLWSTICWTRYSRALAVILALLGVPFAVALLTNLIVPDSEERRQARRARTETRLADRAVFEKRWRRGIRIVVGTFVLILALVATVCWRMYSKSFVVLPMLWGLGILALPCLILLFTKHIPMSDEKYEEQLAQAKARYERVKARSAEFARRKAERAERLEERKKQQQPSNPSANSFHSFVYWSVMLCIFWFSDRSRWRKPDLVFLAMPAWYLIRAIYFHLRPTKYPQGPDAPFTSEPSAGSTSQGL